MLPFTKRVCALSGPAVADRAGQEARITRAARIFIRSSSPLGGARSRPLRFDAKSVNSFHLSILLIECFSVMERIVGPLFRWEKRMGKQISFAKGRPIYRVAPLSGPPH